VFLEGLHSPFGMALVGDDFYVADFRRDPEISLPCRRHKNHRGRRETGGPARGTLNHHWTKDLTASPDGSKLYATVGFQQQCRRNGIEAED